MATPVGLGVPVPKMLPIIGTWTLPFALYQAILSTRVCLQRVEHNVMIGDKSNPGPRSSAEPDPLELASRAHGNFLENVPLAFIFAAVAELNGANKKNLNYIMATLLVLRIAHVELGLRAKENAAGAGRIVGYYGTQGALLGLAGWAGWLVKGYWGY
ncbi:MAG: hypothetical protein MMC23_003094 [Stictis urceolatum]|nr:hypothetical protein [Stictis urceolata]